MSRKLVLLLKMLAASAALIGVSVIILSRTGGKDATDGATEYFFGMGTSESLTLYNVKTSKKDELIDRIKLLLTDDTENIISRRREGSELYRLNSEYKPGKAYTGLSDELYSVISLSLAISADCEGAFDISVRPLSGLWGIEEKTTEEFAVPSESEIAEALSLVGYNHVSVAENSVTLDISGMELDLGACGKGYALDRVKSALDEAGAGGAVVSCGGSILVYGDKGDGNGFKVGIRDPFKEDGSVTGYLEFAPGSMRFVSTSGDYEKYIEKDGARYHHILDTRTGRPADSGLSSVTVIAENGLVSDALSTACFVLGEEKSKPLLEKYGCEAVFIAKDGQMSFTDGAKKLYRDA